MTKSSDIKIGTNRKFVRVRPGQVIELHRLKSMKAMLHLEMEGIYKNKRISIASVVRHAFALHPRARREKCMHALDLAIWRAEHKSVKPVE